MRTEVRHVETRTHGRFLLRRPGADAGGLLVGFHGYMENAETQMSRLEAIPGADAWTLVSIQGLHRFYRGRSEEIAASWMTRQDRALAMADNVAYVDRVLTDVTGDATVRRVVYVGFSQGGAMAFRAATRCAFRADAVVCAGADVPPELLEDQDVSFPPVFLARGERDEWLTPSRFESDIAALRARGVTVHRLVYPGAHEWNTGVSEAVAAFLRHLF
ncbi:MAG TPA: dienelactone hydrolase family protein [Chloroflexota bacterium]|nr:dienelactone hydrolase family protein [Chloroflexota bacterium]